MNKLLLTAMSAVALLGAGAASAASLTTTFAGGNGQSGNMFDIVVGANDLTLTSVVANIQNGSTYEAYYRIGGVGTALRDSSAWTLFSTNTITGTGQVAINLTDLSLAANTTYGLYLTLTDGSVSYTDGTAVGDVTASNADLSIREGYGKEYAFGASFEPRIWNGTLDYTVGAVAAVPEPATWGLMVLGFGAVGFAARRRRAAGAVAA